jgi:excisionase family DNA binding protein
LEDTLKKPFLLTLEQLSQEINMPVRTIRLRIQKGELRATKPGRSVLVYWDSVVEMLKRSEMKAS